MEDLPKKSMPHALRTLVTALIAVGSALVLGFALQVFASDEIMDAVQRNVTIPIDTMFMNALSMIATPVTFFAIVASSSHFTNTLQESKRGRRLLVRYVLSGAFAVFVGFLVFCLCSPLLIEGLLSDSAKPVENIDGNLITFIVSLVPTNIIYPFLEGNSLQILLLAILVGVAVGFVRRQNPFVGKFFDGINQVFIKVLYFIFKAAPYALFFAVLGMVSNAGIGYILVLLLLLVGILVGLVVLVVVRLGLLKACGVSPGRYLKKYLPFSRIIFSSGSTIDSVPDNVEFCEKHFKLNRSLLESVIPFCAHNNMDGNCLFVGFTCFVVNYACGLGIDAEVLAALMFFVVILSAGAPNQPGSGIICMAVLLPAMGVESSIMVPIIFSDLLIELFISYANNLGDIATLLSIAKQEDALPEDAFDME